MNRIADKHAEVVMEELGKFFDSVWVDYYYEHTAYWCSINKVKFEFPFENKVLYKANSYDIVNSIWEYIAKEVL